jgi:hypothetical protein
VSEQAERRAIAAALKKAGPLAQHPAYTSAWRKQAAREQVDSGMER